ncbi:hypothetical protein LT493_29350 [Streptomyces tricolor]|nr:hypothetical protein [Streptomyces tricolor]
MPQQAAAAQPAAPVTPLTSGPGGGQASWAQQVHQLAGGRGRAARGAVEAAGGGPLPGRGAPAGRRPPRRTRQAVRGAADRPPWPWAR